MAISKKEAFMTIIKQEIFDREDIYVENYPDIWEDAKIYFNALVSTNKNGKSNFTENGKMILRFMQENRESYNNLFKAKDIGEQLSISSRTVSGGMRKLVTDGYVEKIGESPVVYSITDVGINTDLSNIEETSN